MAADDYEYGSNTTGVLAIGQSKIGSIEEATDQDSFAVSLKAGREYAFNLNRTFDPGTPGGGSISLQDSTGSTLVSENVVTWFGAGCTYRPTVDGTYYLTVSGTNSGGDAFTGAYAVSASGEKLRVRSCYMHARIMTHGLSVARRSIAVPPGCIGVFA